MSRLWWIIILVAAGVGLAVLVGVLGTRNDDDESKGDAVASLCSSLQSLESSIQTLTGLDASTATKNEFDADVQAVEDDWDQVKSGASDVQDASTGDLDSAWDDFTSAVNDIPDDASVQDAINDVSESAQGLMTAAEETASEVSCS